MTDFWEPDVGDVVWLNHPDGRKLGVVVGRVQNVDHARFGQPIIQDAEDPTPAGRSQCTRRFCSRSSTPALSTSRPWLKVESEGASSCFSTMGWCYQLRFSTTPVVRT